MCVGILNVVYLPFRLCKVKNKITYISRQSDAISLDYQILVRKMEQKHPEVKNIVLSRKITGGEKLTITYPFHMIRQMYHLATSKVVLVDGYCIAVCVLPHKKETKVIQIWHAAAAIKKFGYQTLDMPSGSSSEVAGIMRMHRNYDYVTTVSEISGKHFCEAFQIPKEKLVYVGMPHFSELNNFENEEQMNKEYPQLKEKKNILYLPTFRKGKHVQIEELVRAVDFEKYNLIARLHPLDMPENKDDRVIYDNCFTTYDWIKKSDIVIADYSSLIVECAILKKQLYFYLYDLKEYARDPGLNLDFEKEGLMPFVFKNSNELTALLEKKYDDQILERFVKRYVEIDVENSAELFLKFIRK